MSRIDFENFSIFDCSISKYLFSNLLAFHICHFIITSDTRNDINIDRIIAMNIIFPSFPLPLGSFYFVINQAINQVIPPSTNSAGNTPPSNSMLVFSLPSRLVNVCSKSPSISFFQFMQPLLSFLRRYSQCAKLNLPLNGVGVFHPPIRLPSNQIFNSKLKPKNLDFDF